MHAPHPHQPIQSPEEIKTKIKGYLAAWKENAASATFADLTLAQFAALVQPSLDTRTEIEALDEKRKTLVNLRSDADKISAQALKDVSKAIAGDKKFGTNSTLWEKTGHVRDDERASGLTRKHSEGGGASKPAGNG